VGELAVDVRLAFPGFTLQLAHRFALSGVTVVFGPSGCGKTTLLRILAGLERRASGRVAFDDEVWQDARSFTPPHRRGVGTVFQDARLFPHLSVEGNLRYAARRAPRTSAPLLLDDVVVALGLGALRRRRVQTLSGGEKQRIAIARTLLTRPRLLLLDEPLIGLDAPRKAEILATIDRLPVDFGVPVLYVTHSLDEVIRVGDRMVALSEGRLRAGGEVVEVLESLDLGPEATPFEAGTVLAGTVLRHDPRFRLTQVEVEGQALEAPELDLPAGTSVRLRVRARDVALALRRPESVSIRNVLSGRVLDVAEDPQTAFAEIGVAIGGQRLRARITRAAAAELGLAPGQPVLALLKSIALDQGAMPRPPRRGARPGRAGDAKGPRNSGEKAPR